MFICNNCGNESLRWEGKCPSCQEWNSLVEFDSKVKRTHNFENIPYRIKFGNQSIFKTLNENNNSPFRVSAIGKKYQSTLRKDGMEILDYRGPIQHRYYREYIKLIVTPQLKTKQQQDWFDNYWYNIDYIIIF